MAPPAAHAGVGRRALSPRPGGTRGSHGIADRTRALAGLQPRSHAGRGALAMAARGRHLPPQPCTAEDLSRRVTAFEARLNQDPCTVADRLWVKDRLHPEEGKLRLSKETRARFCFTGGPGCRF